MHTDRLPAGFEFLVPLPRLDGEPETLITQVVYCAAAAPQMFSVGARFTGQSPVAVVAVEAVGAR